jgi:hypothetical protein
LAQPISSILESREEQTELLQQLMANSAHSGNGARNAPSPAPASTTYSDFTATHPPLFTEADRVAASVQCAPRAQIGVLEKMMTRAVGLARPSYEAHRRMARGLNAAHRPNFFLNSFKSHELAPTSKIRRNLYKNHKDEK